MVTTEQVRSKYATVLDDTQGWRHSDEWGADFDRWLAQVKAAAVGQARAETAEAIAQAILAAARSHGGTARPKSYQDLADLARQHGAAGR